MQIKKETRVCIFYVNNRVIIFVKGSCDCGKMLEIIDFYYVVTYRDIRTPNVFISNTVTYLIALTLFRNHMVLS